MNALRRFWRSLFDVRPGEYAKTALMSLYLMLVLFAYYILKPVSRALFLNTFDIDKLPWLYVLIASIGGVLTYFYTKMAVKSSLRRAVTFANIFCVAVLVLFWWLIQLKMAWVIYAFNVWVSLFSIMLVSQGWLVSANVFTSREAKRLYGILGVGSVIGAAFGGQFTAIMVYYIGTNNLLLASAGMVVLSYVAYRAAVAASGRDLGAVKGAEEEGSFSFGEILGSLKSHRHLQVIVAIIVITFLVDVMVDFQFSAYAKAAYQGRDLTAFLGNFYGFWLNLVTFVLQLFLTGFVVSRFGVGGTLQIMPVTIACASLASLLAPSLLSTAATRLTEASTRYSFNKTGMELLYLPLPLDLRNRTKPFVDVFVDRFSRGLGGMILVLFNSTTSIDPHQFSILVLVLAAIWIGLSILAQREYVATVRRRLESRRLDLESARITVSDRATIALLEKAARGPHGRQAAYALDLLGQAPGYHLDALLAELVSSPLEDVRARVFELARKTENPELQDAALAEIRGARLPGENPAVREAVLYAMSLSGEPAELARRLLEHSNPAVPRAAIDSLTSRHELAAELIDHEWLNSMASDSDAQRRALAARAIGVRGDAGTECLYRLLNDSDVSVLSQAIRSAGLLASRDYLPALVRRLADPRLRGAAIEALLRFGPKISGTLSDVLEDPSIPVAIRRYVPRVLGRIVDQRSVDVLLRTLPAPDLTIRSAVLKALSKLRDADPNLNFGAERLVDEVHDEAKYYFRMHAALAALRECDSPPVATTLLIRTLEDRLESTLDRLFRLLGLRYPPKQIYAAYLAIHRGRKTEEFTAALDFLEDVLDRELKRILLPLLDEDAVLAQHGRELFSIGEMDVAGALRELIHSGDVWLASSAMAAAAELKVRDVAHDIRSVGDSGGKEVAGVARAAEAALA
jgi:AAA family ATP:ADP antiporter